MSGGGGGGGADGRMSSVEELREEIGRLQLELEQAAHYGLAVLQQKETLQAEHEQLETLYDAAGQELKSAKDALMKTQLRQRKVSELGISHEEDLLLEEEGLRNSISQLELELKNARVSLEGATTEKEKAEHVAANLGHQLDQLVGQNKQLRAEVKELKSREAQTMSDYSELEEENIALQKQILQLRQGQLEFEVIKQENRRLHEQVEELTAEVDTLNRLKEIVERNSQEMLELLHHEREQRSAVRRELDQRISSESMLTLHTLASLGLGSIEPGGSEDGVRSCFDDPDNPTLKKLEADLMASSSASGCSSKKAQQGDLFSEVHLSQINALEEMLEKLEEEKTGLEVALRESKDHLEAAQKEILEQGGKLQQLKTELEFSTKAVFSFVANHPELEQLAKHYPSYEAALKKIIQMEEEVTVLHAQVSSLEQQMMREDAKENYKESIKQFEKQLACKNDFVSEMETNLSMMRESLTKLSEDLLQLYYVVCDANCETPNRLMQDFAKDVKSSAVSSSPSKGQCANGEVADETLPGAEKPVETYIACYKLTELLSEQMKCASRAVERAIALSRQRSQTNDSEEVSELQEQVVKLRAMLVTKREHVLTLRNVLRANKATAEMAMANLKQRYDHDKAIIASNMIRLRGELTALKEDAAMFASLRVMFAQRCDEYNTTIDQLQGQLAAVEEERKTVNRLLRMAIQQKLMLSARLAEYENRRDTRGQRPFRFMRGRGATYVYSSLPRADAAETNH